MIHSYENWPLVRVYTRGVHMYLEMYSALAMVVGSVSGICKRVHS